MKTLDILACKAPVFCGANNLEAETGRVRVLAQVKKKFQRERLMGQKRGGEGERRGKIFLQTPPPCLRLLP